MATRNRTLTIRFPISLDPASDAVLEALARMGLFGRNKANVAATIIGQWIWDNEEKLRRYGIKLHLRGKRP